MIQIEKKLLFNEDLFIQQISIELLLCAKTILQKKGKAMNRQIPSLLEFTIIVN